MATATTAGAGALERAQAAMAQVRDPEIPALTIAELGILREVAERDGGIVVTLTPTYSGCPATAAIEIEAQTALARAGLPDAQVRTVLSPAWTTDWITEEGRRKLTEAGIAPPQKAAGKAALLGLDPEIACPHCGHAETEKLSEFGATACKALYRCLGCREPFEYFKCI
ncbi:1,2-phenylacetyl-CoA epoxidase subunit PaaD [Marinibaculum pumilum]|uniref:1,2-phenylacetyl-CoA epoxidase subunit PaaD n=1 Tax=Marinibaculum pumilum TaxID=1766165 RepID=A0ABV7L782_9PROT